MPAFTSSIYFTFALMINLSANFSDRMESALGGEYPFFLQALNEPAPVSIRLNPAKPAAVFTDADPVAWHPDGRYLSERPVFSLDPAFHAGAYYVQEASSMFLREALRQTVNVNKKLRVLDFCASPGGKSTLLLSELNEESFLIANEVIQSRVSALRVNIEKWGNANVGIASHDPADFDKLAGFFDVILVDAPCSGEGLFRKDEGAVNHWSEQNLELCAGRQRRILTEAEKLLAPDGVLIYSTCTFNPGENEENIAWLLDSGSMEYLPLQLNAEWGISEKSLGYQFYPHKLKGEGFFLACLKKKRGEAFSMRLKSDKIGDWQPLKSKETSDLASWLKQPNELAFYQKPNGEIVALPHRLTEDALIVGNILRKRSFGTLIGERKGNNFIPSHQLALSNLVNKALPATELDKTQALYYLKKEQIEITNQPKGWVLGRFEGLNLGWMKVLDNRINNYYPKEWRLRMEIK